MAPFPPPSPAPSDCDERAARLQALAARRNAGATPAPNPTMSEQRRGRRPHAAKGARRAALGMSVLTTAGLAGFFAMTGSTNGAGAAEIVTDVSGASGLTGTAAAPTVVDGGVFHNKWGDVQVRATFTNGDLVDVVALRSPDDRGKSVRINDAALPRLTTEALSAQTASVHTVSGATYTSDGYRKSLQSAIDVARAAGVTALS